MPGWGHGSQEQEHSKERRLGRELAVSITVVPFSPICPAWLMVLKELSPGRGGSTVFWGFKSWVTWHHASHTLFSDIFSTSFQCIFHLRLSLSWLRLPWIWYILASGLALILSYYFHQPFHGSGNQWTVAQATLLLIYLYPLGFPFSGFVFK